MGKLTAAGVRSLREPGRYGDGGGLMLHVRSAQRRLWVFRYERAGRERWMTFGTADDVTLADARKAHAAARALLLQGLDPLDERGRTKLDLTHRFAEVAEACIAARSQGWRNARGADQWRNMIRDYAGKALGKMPVAEIGVEHVLKVLRPVWTSKPDVARRLRVRLEAVLEYATAMGWRSAASGNPAIWRGGLKPLLAKPRRQAPHHAALAWREAPALMASLPTDGTAAQRCLAFLILTAVRSGEARGARWSEIDLQGGVWTIPGDRMKTGREHRVPLSDAALDLLRRLAVVRQGELVFPGRYAAGTLADVTLKDVLRRLGHPDITVHGFRSTFRDWCADTGKPADLAEAALAHVTGSAVVRAYQRSDLLDARRVLMAAWADFLTRPAADVVSLRRMG
jgi:integrase